MIDRLTPCWAAAAAIDCRMTRRVVGRTRVGVIECKMGESRYLYSTERFSFFVVHSVESSKLKPNVISRHTGLTGWLAAGLLVSSRSMSSFDVRGLTEYTLRGRCGEGCRGGRGFGYCLVLYNKKLY